MKAAEDAAAPLPPVPVWADELRVARGVPVETPAKPSKPKVDPEVRAQATQPVRDVLTKLEQEIAQGHGKASAGAAAALRNALKEHAKLIDDKLENQAHAALAAAGEMEGWQRWRARPAAPGAGGQGRSLVRASRARGRPGAAAAQAPLWRAQDAGTASRLARAVEADRPGRARPITRCGSASTKRATKPTRSWKPGSTRSRPRPPEHKAQRLALIEEVKSLGRRQPTAKDDDWKGFNRILHQFEGRWRDAGHLSEKAFAELQPQWKEAIQAAAAPLEAVQKQSLDRRHAMIEEAKVLGAAPQLRIDAVKALQQRWQAEAQAIPLDRKHEQKLWDAFRKPIDEAFNRKTEEREKAAAPPHAVSGQPTVLANPASNVMPVMAERASNP